MKQFPLNLLLFYATEKGIESLYNDFKQGLSSHMRDCSHEYNEEEQVIYYCNYNYQQGIDGPVGISKSSKPYSFKDHIRKKVELELNQYKRWLRLKFENSDIQTFKSVTELHESEINSALEKSKIVQEVPINALNITLSHINRYKKHIYIKDSPGIDQWIKEFVEEFSKKTTYTASVIRTYLHVWENNQGRSYPRAIAKRSIEEQVDDMPSDDTIRNWEHKWTHFKEARTEK